MDSLEPNITSEFLSDCFGNEIEILDFKVKIGSNPGDNFTSVLYCVDIECKNKKGEISTKNLLLKCYPFHPARQEFLNNSNMFFKEMEVYRLWIPELKRFQTEVIGLKEAYPLPYAPFVYGKCIDFSSSKDYQGVHIDPLENCIIMEDLRKSGFRMPNRRDTLDLDHIRLVICELAKTHALSWVYKSKVEQDVCKNFPCLTVSEAMIKDIKTICTSVAQNGLTLAVSAIKATKGPESDLIKAMLPFQDLLETIFDVSVGDKPVEILDSILRIKNNKRFGKDSANSEPWIVISHGDCWSNNLLYRYDETTKKPVELILVDLQNVQESSIMYDLAKIIYVCTDSKLRKDHLEDLMKLYVDTFNGICTTMKTEPLPGFNLESFKFRFHRFKLIGLYSAILLFPVTLKEEENAMDMNLEGMEHGKDIADMFTDASGTSGSNAIYTQRIVEIIQEMYDEGVI